MTQTPAGTTGPDGTVVQYGAPGAPHVLTVFADPRCPYCRRMENGLGTVMEQAADEGRTAIEYRFATFIDDAAGGSGSLHAVAALGAARNVGAPQFARYLHELYANQPEESDDRFASPDVLLAVAGEVDGLRSAAFDADVEGGAYLPWARAVSRAFEESGVQGTPTVLLDGRPIPVLNPMGYAISPEAFRALLDG